MPDLHAAGGRLELTQVLEVDEQRVLSMVEIRAADPGRRRGEGYVSLIV